MGLVCVATVAGVEICNGIDDDCDGSIDEEPDVSQNDPKLGVACNAPQAPNDQPPCAAGLTVCKGGLVVCQGAVTPSLEVCDGIDNDCNGSVDMPNPCPEGLLCFEGQCLSPCKGGEFPCPGGFACQNGVCVPGMVSDDGLSTSSSSGGSASSSSGATSSGGGAGGATASSSSSSGTTSSGSGMGGAGGDDTSKQFFGLATGGGGCSCAVPERRSLDPRLAVLCALGLVAAVRRRQARAAKGGAR